MSTVLIGCKLPHGITFKGSEGQAITLNGMNRSMIEGGYGLTHVDESEAALFFATHADFAPVVSQAIFTHQTDSVGDLHDMSLDLQGEKTGFEGLDPAKPAPGLKPDEKQALDDTALREKPPVRAPQSKADKAAARAAAALAAGSK